MKENKFNVVKNLFFFYHKLNVTEKYNINICMLILLRLIIQTGDMERCFYQRKRIRTTNIVIFLQKYLTDMLFL